MSAPTRREKAVFDAALKLAEGQRAAYLQEVCGGDAQFRARVEALLQSIVLPVDPDKTSLVSFPLTEKPGDRIGRYKLLQQIGAGGCGVVYMADQEESVKRRVALKVIKPGMDTKEVLGRFEAERQALALMDHANIAKVLDAGATETGRPFFVMELVRGIPITRYCDENKLKTEQRLELFIQVCQAIQHAHQKGIIHRDIKPSNILVADHDGVPVPKIIDFGIAKATTGQTLTDKTIFTALEQFIGTPAYMSPEQAKMSGLDIDTRSDIYSLGVLLYELLTGKTPFDVRRLCEAGFDEIRRIIREEEPPRPSQKLSTLTAEEQTTTAQARQTDSPRLINLVRGDLDWIVMKCLEKDRNRRYETANGLASDILRHVNNEAVLARPPGNVYRFQKLVRRNKVVFVAGTVVAVAVLAGLAVSTYFFIREKRADRARAMEHDRGLEDKAELTRIKAEVARLTAAAEAETARKKETLNELRNQVDVYEKAGRHDEAIKLETQVLALSSQVYGPDHPDTLKAMNSLVSFNAEAGRRDEALKLREELLLPGRWTNSIGMLFAWIPNLPGCENRRWTDVRECGGWVGCYEVTQDEFKRVLQTNPSKNQASGRGKFPVENMSFYDATHFCEELTRLDGQRLPSGWHYVLPTEDQWKFFAAGTPVDTSYAYFAPRGVQKPKMPQSVGLLKPNLYGLYDVLGNVAELTSSLFHYSTDPDTKLYMVCGGGFDIISTSLATDPQRVVDLNQWMFKGPAPDAGFRVILVPH